MKGKEVTKGGRSVSSRRRIVNHALINGFDQVQIDACGLGKSRGFPTGIGDGGNWPTDWQLTLAASSSDPAGALSKLEVSTFFGRAGRSSARSVVHGNKINRYRIHA